MLSIPFAAVPRRQRLTSARVLPVLDTAGVDWPTFERYAGLSLPRHVSYPMPTWWKPLADGEPASLRSLAGDDLSLYLHLPFCEALCKFCACNRTILRKRAEGAAETAEAYLGALGTEIALRGRDLVRPGGRRRVVRQLHWGGGTPTYLDCRQIERVHRATLDAFDVAEDAEVSIEVDPRVTTREQLRLLASLGFDRVSLGVQDFDPAVQKHVHRVQSYELVASTVNEAREAGFTSVNFDLIYGLPYQTLDTIVDTVTKAISLSPDRVAFYHYAQIPEKIANQRGIHHERMPASDVKLAAFLSAARAFADAGYEFIGLDHFARPTERLAKALRDGTINRNFQGMTTGAPLDVIGLGSSAISGLPGRAYLQNVHDPNQYVEKIGLGLDPGVRGLRLTPDDAIRQATILDLYCTAGVDAERIGRRFGIDFATYFADELRRLGPLVADGLVEPPTPRGDVRLTFPLGRILMRNVAAVFDAYLNADAERVGQPQAFSANA